MYTILPILFIRIIPYISHLLVESKYLLNTRNFSRKAQRLATVGWMDPLNAIRVVWSRDSASAYRQQRHYRLHRIKSADKDATADNVRFMHESSWLSSAGRIGHETRAN